MAEMQGKLNEDIIKVNDDLSAAHQEFTNQEVGKLTTSMAEMQGKLNEDIMKVNDDLSAAH